MGTDIHYDFQKKTVTKSGEIWEDLNVDQEYQGKFYIGRDYMLFSVLADVRNGVGFAGVQTYDPLPVIVEPRGLPKDLRFDDDFDDSYCYGDHSYSYLYGSEIMDFFNTPHITTRYGIVSKASYNEWDGVTPPDSWCGGIGGPDVLIYDAIGEGGGVILADDVSHVKIDWQEDVNEHLSYFKAIIELLISEHGEIRMVFGFDS